MGFGFGLPLNWETDVVEQNQSFEIRNLIGLTGARRHFRRMLASNRVRPCLSVCPGRFYLVEGTKSFTHTFTRLW